MTDPDTSRRDRLTGTRIRDRRMAAGIKQADLAARAGISASYLNLIEHNRRRIGGKLLIALARALDVEPSVLNDGADATLRAALNAAAGPSDPGAASAGPAPETDRVDELATRFPGWTALIAGQQARIEDLHADLEALRDRLSHDPKLADAMHEILSSAAAIRSTAEILAGEAELDPAWRTRFHRNLHEEAQRLSDRATGLVAQFETPLGSDSVIRPVDRVEAAFDAAGHHFPAIEAGGAAAVPQVLAALGPLDAAAADLAAIWLATYAKDAARLPLAELEARLDAAGADPAALLSGDMPRAALILRRLACLPSRSDRAPFGLAIVDGAGGLVFRRRADGFTLPRLGARCPRWPVYRALTRPGQPEDAVVSVPGLGLFRTWSVAEPVAHLGFGLAPMAQATMLVRKLAEADAATGAGAIEVGPDCPVCRAAPGLP